MSNRQYAIGIRGGEHVERGLSVLDVLVILIVVAILLLAAFKELPRYQQQVPPKTVTSDK